MTKIVKITIAVPESFRNQIKIHAIKAGKSLKDYIVETLKKQMKQDEILNKQKIKEA